MDKLQAQRSQQWVTTSSGPVPGPVNFDVTVIGDDGNVWHRWWDGSKLNAWENWGKPPTS